MNDFGILIKSSIFLLMVWFTL